jgi:hypothetical protein
MSKIYLPCGGGYKAHKIHKTPHTITFVPDGSCKLTAFRFTKNAGAFKKHGGAEFEYDYDGSAIPATGAEFSYGTDATATATTSNGSGVIHN